MSLIESIDAVNLQQMKALLAAGVKPDDEKNYWGGYTALMRAAMHGRTNFLSALIRAKADVNLKSKPDDPKDGDTALIWAAWARNSDCVSALIAANADLDLKNNGGYTALMRLAIDGKSIDCLSALIAANADLDLKSNGGDTALILAAHFGRPACLSALIRAKADLDLKNDDGKTALDVMIEPHMDLNTSCGRHACIRVIKKLQLRVKAVRQWYRIFSAPERFLARASGPEKMLIDFFVVYPGLRRQFGRIFTMYYNPFTAKPCWWPTSRKRRYGEFHDHALASVAKAPKTQASMEAIGSTQPRSTHQHD